VNTAVAKRGLVKICQETADVLQQALDCEKEYAEIVQIQDVPKRFEALNRCLEKYEKAFNRDKIISTTNELEKQINRAKMQQSEEDRLRLAREQQAAAQTQQTVDQHHERLTSIRNIETKRVALIEIRKFLDENPNSPVMTEARLLAAEIEGAVVAEKQSAKRILGFGIGSGVVFGLAVVAWLMSCIKVHRPKQVMDPLLIENDSGQLESPFNPQPKVAAASQPQRRILLLATIRTPQDDLVPCPECGALVDCPPEVREEDVICGACRKAFHVH